MKKILLMILLFYGCNNSNTNYNTYNNKNNLDQLIDTYIFLSENHDLLHIMMGEYEGSPISSLNEYKNKIKILENNLYIQPILFGLNNITINNSNTLENAEKFDSLVDHYQIGIQLMIEGILKGYNIKNMPKNTIDYNKIKSSNFTD